MESSSDFIIPAEYSSDWHDITLVQTRSRTRIYTASRYGRRFVLKAYKPEIASMTESRLQQEREFQFGILLVHPNIAATYSLEEVEGVGRCIVQEWIDGMTLGEWLQTNPPKAAKERVFDQLLDALEYLHGLQLVHHDLKSDNILITRNGANVKLIDFSLSADDATISPVSNDPQADIAALRRLFPSLMPRGCFDNIAALRLAIRRRQRAVRILPVSVLCVLLAIACVLLASAAHERNAGQQRYEQALTCINDHIAQEKEQIQSLINSRETFSNEEQKACMKEYTAIRHRQWQMRDSLIATYDENAPLRVQLFSVWTQKELDLDNQLLPQMYGKFKP